ncbi:hypothetical protein ANN_04417 [Periplaneta americana]|uniref:Uncharacterized protein n=1 Tax=Periplaneta americana TaxID=6978 RepID=A0ABQ8T8I0_PERAM|nr:hypothetical protein ANN_04417 [Periplaneta americana]
MRPGSSTESYPAFAHIGLRENLGKNLNQVTCSDWDSNQDHLVSRSDALTVTPQRDETEIRYRLRDIRLMVGEKFGKNPTRTGTPLLSKPLQLATHINISERTVRRRLDEANLRSQRPAMVLCCLQNNAKIILHLQGTTNIGHMKTGAMYSLQTSPDSVRDTISRPAEGGQGRQWLSAANEVARASASWGMCCGVERRGETATAAEWEVMRLQLREEIQRIREVPSSGHP